MSDLRQSAGYLVAMGAATAAVGAGVVVLGRRLGDGPSTGDPFGLPLLPASTTGSIRFFGELGVLLGVVAVLMGVLVWRWQVRNA